MSNQWKIIFEGIGIFLALQAIFYFFAIYSGQDTNWDQRNYHTYLGAMWLKGNALVNLIPAHIQSWLNPVGVIFTVFPILYLPPLAAVFILCLYSSSCLLLVFLITRIMLFGSIPESQSRIYGVIAMVIAGATPSFLSEIGTTYNDNLISFLVLLSLLCFLNFLNHSAQGFIYVAFSGVLLGITVGLKLTALVYVLSFCISLILFKYVFHYSYKSLLICFLGVVCGFLLTYSFWGSQLYLKYGNPVFPFYNAIFHSDYFTSTNIVDSRFVAKNFTEFFIYPFKSATINNFHQELNSRYVQFLLFIPSFLIFSYFILRNRFSRNIRKFQDPALTGTFLFILTFSSISYIIWLAIFGIQRYFMTIELLLGVLITVNLVLVLRSKVWRILILSVIMILSVGFVKYPDWGRHSYTDSWYSETLTEKGKEENILYVMNGGGEPYAYIIPFFPSSCRFMRVTGNLSVKKIKNTMFYPEFMTLIKNHDSIFSIYPQGIKPNYSNMALLGLEPVPGKSEVSFMTTKIDRYVGVPLRKVFYPTRKDQNEDRIQN